MTEWQVYILECADGSLYTGIARNLDEAASGSVLASKTFTCNGATDGTWDVDPSTGYS